MRQRGFTLIELLVVIAIIGILATIVLASLSVARKRGQVAAGQEFATSLYHGFGAEAALLFDFDETPAGTNALDKTGRGNVGVMMGASRSSDTPSGSGYSVTFSNSKYVDVAPTAPMTISSAFTLGAWIKPDVAGGTFYKMIMTGYDGTDVNFSFYLNQSATPALGIFLQNVPYNSTYVPPGGEWTYVAVTYASGKVTFYANGKDVGSVSAPAPDDGTDELLIGSFSDSSYFFQGKMDDIAVYTQALTASAIAHVYAESAPKYLAQK